MDELFASGRALPTVTALFAALRSRHPDWRAKTDSTLRKHLENHEPRWKR